jgi:hypothetical protein
MRRLKPPCCATLRPGTGVGWWAVGAGRLCRRWCVVASMFSTLSGGWSWACGGGLRLMLDGVATMRGRWPADVRRVSVCRASLLLREPIGRTSFWRPSASTSTTCSARAAVKKTDLPVVTCAKGCCNLPSNCSHCQQDKSRWRGRFRTPRQSQALLAGQASAPGPVWCLLVRAPRVRIVKWCSSREVTDNRGAQRRAAQRPEQRTGTAHAEPTSVQYE